MSELRVTEKGIAIGEGTPAARWHFCFLNWSRWETFREGLINKYHDGLARTYVCGSVKEQRRVCLKCGKLQMRMVTIEL
jgi:hypothetical protein